MNTEITLYNSLLTNIKNRVRQGQFKANIVANTELLATYWDIGRLIYLQQQKKGWGQGVIPKLAADLKNELSEEKGFSERNLKFMVQFYNEYQNGISNRKPPVSHLKDGAIVKPLANTHVNWAKQTFKDPYIFDFLTLATEFSEKELLNANDKEVAQ